MRLFCLHVCKCTTYIFGVVVVLDILKGVELIWLWAAVWGFRNWTLVLCKSNWYSLLLNLLTIFFFYSEYMWRSEDSFWKFVLFSIVWLLKRATPQVIRADGKCLSPLSHLARPQITFKDSLYCLFHLFLGGRCMFVYDRVSLWTCGWPVTHCINLVDLLIFLPLPSKPNYKQALLFLALAKCILNLNLEYYNFIMLVLFVCNAWTEVVHLW